MAYSVKMDDAVKGSAVRGAQTDSVDDRVLAFIVIASIFFFFVINKAVRQFAERFATWRWRNLAVSWVHADICACWCVYCWYWYKDQITELSDLFYFQPTTAYFLVAFSTGYFLYDLLDQLREGQLIKQWEVTLHHIFVLFIFFYNLVYHFAMGYVVLALVVELNSVFLHGRKLLQMLHIPFQHPFYRVVTVLNLLTFFVFRFGPITLIWVGFLKNLDLCTNFYTLLLGSVMAFMAVLNAILFWRLLRSDVLRGRMKGREKKGEVDNNANDRDNGSKNVKASSSSSATTSFTQRNGYNFSHRPQAT